MKHIYILSMIIQIIFGFILADIIAGIFHWFEDTYLAFNTELPFFDEIAKDNELHHYFPRSLVYYSNWDNVTYTLPVSLIFIGILILVGAPILKYIWFFSSFCFFFITSNIIHKYSHMRECELSPFIRVLQKLNLLCSHEQHAVHHTTENDGKYCVISGFMNTVLDNLHFWRALECLIYIITGKLPNRKPGYDDYRNIHLPIHLETKMDCPPVPSEKNMRELKQKLSDYFR